MYSLSVIAAVAALVAFAAGAPVSEPIEIPRSASTYSITQVPNPGFKGFHASGPAAMAKAYAKYKATMPDDLVKAVAAGAKSGTVPANPQQYDSEYLSPVKIGTPAQTLNLNFDTGSADLWVFSSETAPSEVKGQKLYLISSSSTAKKLPGQKWSIRYGDGSGSSGDVYTDVVALGAVSYPSQAVESAKQVSSSFTSDSASSGLLGLAFSSINTVTPTSQKTFFANVQSSLAAPLFTADLKKGAVGSYDFGYIDSAKHNSTISYVPVNAANGFWEFTGSGYAVGSGSFVSTRIDAIADTGTTLLLIPNSVVRAYYSKVSGASYSSTYGGYVFPCTAKLPSFTFGAGSYRGTIPGSFINFAPVDSSNRKCYGGIQSDDGIGFSIYGDILLKAQFVVFDGGNTRLGFASKIL